YKQAEAVGGEETEGKAAAAGRARLESDLERQRQQGRVPPGLLLAGPVALAGLAGFAFLLWRESEPARIRRIERLLRRAERALSRGDFARREVCLARADRELAFLRGDHPRAEALLCWARRCGVAGPTWKARPALRLSVSSPPNREAIRTIVAGLPYSADAARTCLEWLARFCHDR